MEALNSRNAFGRWTITGDAILRDGHYFVRCRCTCGTEKEVRLDVLKSGNSKSCGCLRTEMSKKRLVSYLTTHGHAKSAGRSPTYASWVSMRQRCFNKQQRRYSDYGGRGILICERWNSFENFLADMGERPYGTSLDRIDNGGNYEPGNCRWVTCAEQNKNKRSTKLNWERVREIRQLYGGGRLSQSELCTMFGISKTHMCRIVHNHAWKEKLETANEK